VDLITLHRQAGESTGRIVAGISDAHWEMPTPIGWTVRELLNHLIYGNRWVPPLLEGKTIAEVGDRFEGDLLGADPHAAWRESFAAAQAAFEQPGALEAITHLSYGDLPGVAYCRDRILDIFIHGWDLARGSGQDDTLDPEICQFLYAENAPQEAMLRASGAFGERVEVTPDADLQTRLLALLGRRR
jgi:uncharacterized protein (TIGR03086 family)